MTKREEYVAKMHAALEQMKGRPHRRKVTFEWNAEDVVKVSASAFRPGEDPFMGLAASLRATGAEVLSGDLAEADVEKLAVAIAAKSEAHQAAILVPIDQVDDGTGTPRDPDRFVADLAEVITDVVADPDRARGMGLAGRRRAEREFSWGAIAERTLDVYRLATG